MEEQCFCHTTKERSEKEYKDLIHRLNRIEGQIRGIRGMVEKNCYCPDILIQVAAANAALNSFNKFFWAIISAPVWPGISGMERMKPLMNWWAFFKS